MRTMRAIPLVLLASSVMSATACGGASHSAGTTPVGRVEAIEPPQGQSRSDRIAAGDLSTVQGRTAADAIRRLRPEFLRAPDDRTSITVSPASPTVYVDGRYAGELSVLDLIPLDVVVEIQRLDSVAAKSLFGSYCPCSGGVILVRVRR